jgi:acetoin utilization deacetylase AcuC-like enzyme
VAEAGVGTGRGRTVNVPIEPGAGDDDYAQVLARVVVPVLAEFKADLVIVSAGYDAHVRDPLAEMQVTDDGYRAMLATLRAAADTASAGRLVVVTEGGYDLPALAACLEATVEVLAGEAARGTATATAEGPARGSGPGVRGRAAAEAALAVQRAYWRQL